MTGKCRENLGRGAFSRLAAMRQPITFALALTLGCATAFGLVSCGGGEDAKLLPGTTAQEISENLDAVKQLADENECIGAADEAQEVSAQVEELNGVDPKLVRALEAGAARLTEVVASCQEEETTETVGPASEATETEEEDLPPGQEKKAEKEREKEEKELEKEEEKQEEPEQPPAETTPAEPPTTPAPPPSEGGGTGAPGGVSPGEPAAPGGE
jgi:outer membrane biosynthesis protein TonB